MRITMRAFSLLALLATPGGAAAMELKEFTLLSIEAAMDSKCFNKEFTSQNCCSTGLSISGIECFHGHNTLWKGMGDNPTTIFNKCCKGSADTTTIKAALPDLEVERRLVSDDGGSYTGSYDNYDGGSYGSYSTTTPTNEDGGYGSDSATKDILDGQDDPDGDDGSYGSDSPTEAPTKAPTKAPTEAPT